MMLPADTFDRMTESGFSGFGYLGERRGYLTPDDPSDISTREQRLAQVDRRILELADERGWDYERLFDWANSKLGRWFADVVLGTDTDLNDAWVIAVDHWQLIPASAPAPEWDA